MSHFGVTLDDVIENLYNLYKHGNLIKTRNKGKFDTGSSNLILDFTNNNIMRQFGSNKRIRIKKIEKTVTKINLAGVVIMSHNDVIDVIWYQIRTPGVRISLQSEFEPDWDNFEIWTDRKSAITG